MQNFPDAADEGSENLPARSDERKISALTIARNNQQQQLSLDLRTGLEPEEAEDQINLLDYWRILVKRKWTVLATMAMVVIIALVSTLLTTPIYRATATMQLERNSMQVVQVGGINTEGSPNYSYDGDFQQTQIELLKSRALAQRVVSQMGLLASGEMDGLWPGSTWEKLSTLIGGKSDEVETPTPKPVATSGKEANARLNSLAAAFQGGFSVTPVGSSQLVKINYDSPDPLFSQRAANAISEAFVAQNLERRFDSTSYAKNYLEDRLQELKLKLEDSERKLVAFAQKEQIVSAGDESGANLTEQNLGSLNSAYAKAKEARIIAESRWQQAPSLRGTGLQNTTENPMIKTLQESRAKLMLEYQDKLRLYKPDYPVMQQLKAQIDEVNKQVITEEGNIRSGIQAEYQAALQQERMLATQLTSLKGEVLDLQNRSIQYNIFKREVDTNRQLYDALLQRYKEIGVAGGVSANNISLVDRAEPGYKFKPDLSRNMKMAALAGLVLGMLLALAFEYLDDTIKRPEDIEKLLGLPVLGAIPLLKAPQTPAKALEDVRSAFAESYRSLRTALQFSTDRGVPRSLLITSATPSEGKSTTALVLGQYYAQLGKRVLIVDCDLRNPSLHRALNVDNDQGLSNYLAGAIKPTDLIRQTPTEGLMYLPTGPLPPNPAELLMGSKMVSLLTVAAEKFDILILDGPPVMGLADAPILSNLAQGTLLVVQASETRVAVVKNAIKRLNAARAHIVGGLLTHFRPEEAGQGYGYGGYNYYSYGSGRPQLTKK
jgi:capsular exopolysaccharide synthesis family protein